MPLYSPVYELLRLLRPHQWVKNVFVFAGLLFGQPENMNEVAAAVVLAFVAFSLISSAIYVVNDLCDREQDRQHPQKRTRPLAAGTVTVPAALVTAAALTIGGLLSAWAASTAILLFLGLYIALNLAYSAGLKHVVILDVFLVAAGFMLRLLAGTVGVDIPPSQWLLLCGLMIALFLGFAKRRSEMGAGDSGAHAHRKVLASYTPAMLDGMIIITAACTVLSYSLYTVSPETVQVHGTTALIYTVPFVLYGIFRYLFALYSGRGGGDPARDLLRDPHILAAAVGWLGVTWWLIR